MRTAWRRLIEPDMLLAVSAVVISLCALGVSIIQVQVMREETSILREQQHATVWPRLEVLVSTGEQFALQVRNQGVGPALIESTEVRVDGIARQDWQEVFAALGSDPPWSRASAKLRDRVLAPGELVQALAVTDAPLAATLARERDRVDVRVCYCSVYGRCWTTTRPSLAGGAELETRQVDGCSSAAAHQFRY